MTLKTSSAGTDQEDRTRFFHGTSTVALERACASGGLRRPFVTDDPDRAWYYAEEAAEEVGGDPVVVEVLDVVPALLRYDGAAMDEPVMAEDSDRDAAWAAAAGAHPEWVTASGTLLVPAHAWEVSWDGVGSARYDTSAAKFRAIG